MTRDAQAEEVIASAAALARMADQLDALVARFNLEPVQGVAPAGPRPMPAPPPRGVPTPSRAAA